MIIRIERINPPIPTNQFDIMAVVDGYEERQWQGFGRDIPTALRDLADRLDMVDDIEGYPEVFEDQEPEPCRTCAGTGIGRYGDPNTSNCRDCKGTGEEQDPEPSDWGG